MEEKKSFTLLELIIVLVVLGILASITPPFLRKALERARNKEAISMLRLLAETEKMYHLQYGNYTQCNDSSPDPSMYCNSVLGLTLPSRRDWAFAVQEVGRDWRGAAGRYVSNTSPYSRLFLIDIESGNIICYPVGSKYCE